jgi:GcrA cell cycle regulator
MRQLSPAQETRLRAAWSDPRARLEELALELGMTRRTLHIIAESLNLGLRKKALVGDWTVEKVEAFKVLWGEGKSGSEIAKALGLRSRSAVLSKARRLNLPNRDVAECNRVRAAKRPKGPPKPRPKKRHNNFASINSARRKAKAELIIVGCSAAEEPAPPPKVIDKEDAFNPLPGSTPKPWTEREFGECAWPVGGEGAETLSCCQKVSKGSWCIDHARLGFQRPADAKRWDDRLGITKARRAA